MAGAFGGAPNITVVNPAGAAGAGAAAGTTRDQTGQYLSSTGQPNQNLGLPRIIPNPFDNTLIVQGTPQMWEQILHLLDQIDVSPRQVLIDAKIYEITLTGAFLFGVQGFLQQRTANSTSTARQLIGSLANGSSVLSAGLLLGRTRELLGAVSFAESLTKAKIVSSPSLIATDSIPATISVGTDVPTLSAQAVAPGLTNGGTSQFTQSISNVSTGTTLGILARVNASGVVTLVIDQSVTAPVPPSPGGINSPSFSKRNVSTQVTVQDGDTIAIAGIILEQDLQGKGGIPLLDRLPWIGGAFGSVNNSKSRTELIIFLTPRVIYDTNQISDATEELRQKVKGLTKIMKDKY